MFDYCIFDQLPTELLHTIFNYFSASELLFTFHNINDYVNANLQTYFNYQFDCKSISKSQFRYICQNVRPEQVISLTLSDGHDTPGQSQVFFSCFRIEQFIRLQSLTLIDIEFNSLESIFLNLPQLHQLHSFSFDAYTIRHAYGSLDLNSKNKLEHINSLLRKTYAQIFPRLKFLSIKGGWVLSSISMPNLLYLKLDNCPIDKFDTLIDLAPELRSLDICINFEFMNLEVFRLPSRLTRLNLKILDIPVTMNYMESLLSNYSHLKHLELYLMGSQDLIDGHRWQFLTNSFHTFNFKFYVVLSSIEGMLDSFKTSFWLENKQWFVAYENECLFTIPYFAPEQFFISNQSSIQSTAPNHSIFYKNITQICINDTQINLAEHTYPILYTKSLDSIDLRNVKSLSILSLNNLLEFNPIERIIPRLSQLSIKNEITIMQMKEMINNSYEQIRRLEIETNLQDPDYIIEELFRLFPHTEHFIYKPNIQSIAFMTRFIDGFRHLSSASFISLGPLYNEDEKFRFKPELMILKTNRLNYDISICRIYFLPSNKSMFGINWWIEE